MTRFGRTTREWVKPILAWRSTAWRACFAMSCQWTSSRLRVSRIRGLESFPTQRSRFGSRWRGLMRPAARTGNAYRNDLDLVVTVGGKTYKGNVFSGANSATGGSADSQIMSRAFVSPRGVAGSFCGDSHGSPT